MTDNKTDFVPGTTELIASPLEIIRPGKPGIKTTEMWVALIGLVLPGVLAATQANPHVQAALAIVALILPAIYIWGRCILKAEQIKATNVIPDEWEPIVDNALTIAEAVDKAVQEVMARKLAVTPDPDPAAE